MLCARPVLMMPTLETQPWKWQSSKTALPTWKPLLLTWMVGFNLVLTIVVASQTAQHCGQAACKPVAP
jgi:hypothetical protein